MNFGLKGSAQPQDNNKGTAEGIGNIGYQSMFMYVLYVSTPRPA